MIAGGGERVTLRLVAQYGDACNVGAGLGGRRRGHARGGGRQAGGAAAPLRGARPAVRPRTAEPLHQLAGAGAGRGERAGQAGALRRPPLHPPGARAHADRGGRRLPGAGRRRHPVLLRPVVRPRRRGDPPPAGRRRGAARPRAPRRWRCPSGPGGRRRRPPGATGRLRATAGMALPIFVACRSVALAAPGRAGAALTSPAPAAALARSTSRRRHRSFCLPRSGRGSLPCRPTPIVRVASGPRAARTPSLPACSASPAPGRLAQTTR